MRFYIERMKRYNIGKLNNIPLKFKYFVCFLWKFIFNILLLTDKGDLWYNSIVKKQK